MEVREAVVLAMRLRRQREECGLLELNNHLGPRLSRRSSTGLPIGVFASIDLAVDRLCMATAVTGGINDVLLPNAMTYNLLLAWVA